MGIKNYDGFGDQREDHPYWAGPRHGRIVFSVGRVDPENGPTLGADHVYALECLRDFVPGESWRNLFVVIREYVKLKQRLSAIEEVLGAAEVEEQAPSELTGIEHADEDRVGDDGE